MYAVEGGERERDIHSHNSAGDSEGAGLSTLGEEATQGHKGCVYWICMYMWRLGGLDSLRMCVQ